MESGGRKPAGASSSTSSSLSTDLFGPKESLTSTLFPPPNTANSSSTGIFSSVFSPASVGLGRDSARSDIFGSRRKENPEGQAWNGKHASSVNLPPEFGGWRLHGKNIHNHLKDENFLYGSQSSESQNQRTPNTEGRSIFVDDTPEPFSLGSSLYYGGRDICTQSPSTRTSGTSSIFKKDGEEGEGSPPGASRGNWWQGSLYY